MKQLHTKNSYRPFRMDRTKPVRKGKTIPSQAIPIKTIIDRFLRGVPVQASMNKPVYVDQTEFDLEKLSRMSFDEKAAFAADMAARNEAAQADLVEAERERKAKEAERSEAKAKAKEAELLAKLQKGGVGIVVP